jgi:hypothetical protein
LRQSGSWQCPNRKENFTTTTRRARRQKDKNCVVSFVAFVPSW